MNKSFEGVAANPANPRWSQYIARQVELYAREDDPRSPFARDYNRLLHSLAYRRLKHKTQVFLAARNDHICTRIEHVHHVASVSHTIANVLGLNTELTDAISIGHDIGHAPFGHTGEKVLKSIAAEDLQDSFWHEKNSLWFADKIETLPDPHGRQKNLDLTYAVRDGIICHCGEVDDNSIRPRDQTIDLYKIRSASECAPYTWEGCVVKIADKVAYLGRDIEDAIRLGILSYRQLSELRTAIRKATDVPLRDINNTILMHNFIIDLCDSSTPQEGIRFSRRYLDLLREVRQFSEHHIYVHKRLGYFNKYADLILRSIYQSLCGLHAGAKTASRLHNGKKRLPLLVGTFLDDWIIKYSDLSPQERNKMRLSNDVVYAIAEEKDYRHAVLDYVSGMTDSFAIRAFAELTNF
ncbi:MAG: HD domain-containing protein [Chloroflexi bacterium]|nr:HD domain-containing protein [Chloroflexota bacterium]